MTPLARTDTWRGTGDLAAILGSSSFPAAREDLLLQAIATHATPDLIDAIRSLPESWFPDEAAVRTAIAAI